jgi:DHA1 family multidrug resistance protein-like MFS transporter
MPESPAGDWRRLVAVYWITSLVESMGVSQVYALLPTYLASMGVAEADRLRFVGLFGSLIFVVGMPMVPLWGVWADKYSRKAVIIRSAIVEAVVLAGVSLSREPWQLAVSMMLIGFQLGNTGVMLAGIRDVTPRRRLGTTIAIFGASSPVGMAVGPALAGILVDGFHLGVSSVFAVSSACSLATAVLLWLGSAEIRPEVVPTGRVLTLAYGAIRGVLSDPAVRRVFAIFGTAFLANQMSRPYIPVAVEAIVGRGPGLASAIALVSGTAALVGALLSPVAGAIGDRIGFRRVLLAALATGGVALGLMPGAGSIPALAGLVLVFAVCTSAVSAMVFGLLATEVPAERRSTTLNLVYLPLYAAGIVGPAIGAGAAGLAGLPGPFLTGAAIIALGAVAVAVAVRGAGGSRPVSADRAT